MSSALALNGLTYLFGVNSRRWCWELTIKTSERHFGVYIADSFKARFAPCSAVLIVEYFHVYF